MDLISSCQLDKINPLRAEKNRPARVKFTAVSALLLWSLQTTPATLDAAASLPGDGASRVIKDIAYPGAAQGDRRRSLDLYLPADTGHKPPLLIFVHGGFWLLSDDEYRIGPVAAEALVKDGIAVALVRYRLAPANPHPAQAEDVAAAVALLIREAKRYGYASDRIFLAGHSAGGHLAALIALDARYLAKYQLGAQSLAGVVSFSGIYDLSPRWGISENQKIATEKTFGKNPAILKQASPLAHVRVPAPPFLILTSQSDFPGFAPDAKSFFHGLQKAGHRRVERWIVPERDHFTMMRLGDRDNEARLLLLEFMKVAPLPQEFAVLAEAKRRWRDPPFSTAPFWRHQRLIRSYPVDQRLVARMVPVYSELRYELQEWPLEKFYAIDLFAFLDSLPAEKAGRGDYLITTNIRHEKQFWQRQQIKPYEPVIVIGLDDEKNLFRLGVFYRANREYSWKAGPQPPIMARPLGAFIHFLHEPPAELGPQPAQYGLTEDSFRWVARDPLAPLKNLTRDLYDTVTFRNGCVYCHTLRATGSRSHHVTASAGAPHGGFALPLESYSPEVWQNFIFDQHRVAAKIGASPNPVAERVRKPLFDLVNELQQKQNAPATRR
jgi:arylformamidase